MKKIVSLVGARPQFVKEAVLGSAVRETQAWRHVLAHSGQHYDLTMSDIFFRSWAFRDRTTALGSVPQAMRP